jgi:hypothetical protein
MPNTRDDSWGFFVAMGYACAFVAVVGFFPTYWGPLASGSFEGALFLHVHGLLFSAWPFFFIAQATTAVRGRFERHRALGYLGISLATAMLFTGIAVSIQGIDAGIGRGFEAQSRAFSIVPLTIVVSFAALVATAIARVRTPDAHMRLMLIASITLLPPAIARLLFLALSPEGAARPGLGEPPAVVFSLLPSLMSDVLILVALVRDWRVRGRPHPAYLYAGAFVLAVQFARVPASSTAAWHSVTTWLLKFS